ncbi:type VI secretion system-associated FHA domain protein TagH [Marivita sp. XM-24bin2]|uniref:type VI secretion system-associated FHA domain protein TagH n=1 Tax=unclassified Marivita TaxID=2632480 RepID=UPI000D799B96|nr:type VI secretion system-associated FHA domain protein TagH [Marivita sp. XM-24bin2]MCR9108561.1 type VI secretion system-associated FHA domain protein TagH [Paracoccaceae bacterium]PWL36160.1 MAG: type VI secretion system-associated FHA domain protein TagH [Marivita sp. XM-24bin2]
MTVTLKFQSSGMVPGDGRPVQMKGGSLTMGRGPGNDLVLPDPDRMLSKSHFVIEDHNGKIVIVDFSTNGTFLNYSKVPLGRTPTTLNNGDVLSAGGYELVVEIGQELPDLDDLIPPQQTQSGVSHGNADSAPDPFAMLDDPGTGGDFLDDLLGAEGGPTGPKNVSANDPIDDLLPPLGEDEDPFFQKPKDGREGEGASLPMHNPSVSDSFSPSGTNGPSVIPDDWDDFLAPMDDGIPAKEEAQPPVPSDPEPEPEPEADETTAFPPKSPNVAPEPTLMPNASEQAPPPTAPATVATGDQSAARAFVAALDVEDLVIDDSDLERTMTRMGRVMRMMIVGLREILMTRTSIKSEFRIDQTMIASGGNNPLKFSLSEDDAVTALVKPKAKGYLSSETATEQALDDIKAHEIAMVTGMEAAIKGVLAKLDPEVLAGQIETSTAIGSMFKGKKARYWEVYEKMYAQISDQAENDFHELFSREFARAYKEQLDKLK